MKARLLQKRSLQSKMPQSGPDTWNDRCGAGALTVFLVASHALTTVSDWPNEEDRMISPGQVDL